MLSDAPPSGRRVGRHRQHRMVRGDRDQFFGENPGHDFWSHGDCRRLPWRFENEIWFTADGESWKQLSDHAFGPTGLDSCSVTSVVGGNSGWFMLGMRVSDEPTAKSPTGIRLGPHTVAWVGWASPDGITWEPFDIAAIIGDPWCESPGPERCGRIVATATPDAIVTYVHQSGDDDLRDGWTLWIGLLSGRPTGA